MSDPFDQDDMNAKLHAMLTASPEVRAAWRDKALSFADGADLYSMPEKAAGIILGDEMG